MTDETIVAVYDTATHADAAMRDLEAARIPASAITREPGVASGTAAAPASRPVREQGFWSGLFGGEPDHGSAFYDRSIESGSHVVTVRVPEAQVENVTNILERHNPVDLDDRAAGYGISGPTTGASATTATGGAPALGATPPVQPYGTPQAGTAGLRGKPGREGEEVIPLAEEQIDVGKRLVNRGTTRIRRFVVEKPVEENVTLRDERVSVERRPVVGDARVSDADFTDRTIEVTETSEEAIVGKTARVREEVVVRKDVADRVETVRDTVRREDVEITKDADNGTVTGRDPKPLPGRGPAPTTRHD